MISTMNAIDNRSIGWRTVHVFISSTFRDMHSERDHLIKFVFPRLKEKLEEHQIRLIDIDLRWGITKEQADNDQVLELCLEQIDLCKPFFICLLGDRYGWCPDEYPNNVAEKYAWIYSESNKSITELEILHGVLNDVSPSPHCYFYFRNSKVYRDIPEDIRKEIYIDTDRTLKKKLKRLKKKIKKRKLTLVDSYPAMWDSALYDSSNKIFGRITHLEEFGNHVYHQLLEGIKEEFKLGGGGKVDRLILEQIHQDRFIDEQLQIFVGRQKTIQEIYDYIDGKEDKPLLVVGSIGSGKTSVLANVTRNLSAINYSIYNILVPYRKVLKEVETSQEKLVGEGLYLRALKSTHSFLMKIEDNRKSELDHPELKHMRPELQRFINAQNVSNSIRQRICRFIASFVHYFLVKQNANKEQQKCPIPLIEKVDVEKDSNTLILYNFAGVTPYSTNFRQILINHCEIIERFYYSNGAATFNINQVSNQYYQRLLTHCPPEKKIIIIFDGIEQIDEVANSGMFNWMPDELSSNVKIIVGINSSELNKQKSLRIKIPQNLLKVNIRPLDHDEQNEMLKMIPSIAAKTLDDTQIDLFKKNPATTNPLFLKIALEELRYFSSFENLNKRIMAFPSIADQQDDVLEQLFTQVIDRLENDFNIDIVKNILTIISCSKNGLSEKEIRSLTEEENSQHFFTILRQLRPYFIYRKNLILLHNKLMTAVYSKYFQDLSLKKECHYKIGQHFIKYQHTPRKVNEILHQLSQAEEWALLSELLQDKKFYQMSAYMNADMLLEIKKNIQKVPYG